MAVMVGARRGRRGARSCLQCGLGRRSGSLRGGRLSELRGAVPRSRSGTGEGAIAVTGARQGATAVTGARESSTAVTGAGEGSIAGAGEGSCARAGS